MKAVLQTSPPSASWLTVVMMVMVTVWPGGTLLRSTVIALPFCDTIP